MSVLFMIHYDSPTFSLLTSRLTPTTWTVYSPWAGSPREFQVLSLWPMRNGETAVEVLAAPMNWTSFLPCPAAETWTGPVCETEYVGHEKCLEMF